MGEKLRATVTAPPAALLALLVWQAARPLRDSDAGDVFRGINFGAHKFDHLFFCSVASGSASPAVA